MTYSQIVSTENARQAEQEAAHECRLSMLEAKEGERFERKMRRKEGTENVEDSGKITIKEAERGH